MPYFISLVKLLAQHDFGSHHIIYCVFFSSFFLIFNKIGYKNNPRNYLLFPNMSSISFWNPLGLSAVLLLLFLFFSLSTSMSMFLFLDV